MSWIVSNIKGDKIIWTVVFLLSLFSILAVYSSTHTLAYKYHAGNTEYYLFKHTLLLLFGLGIMFLAHLINFNYYSRFAQIILIGSIPLLLYTLVYGDALNSAQRWLTVPIVNISFQTSDLAKLALIMYLAREVSRRQKIIKDFYKGFLPIAVPVVVVCALIAPADLSTAALLFVTSIIVMFIGRVRKSHLSALLLTGFAVLSIIVSVALLTSYEGRVNTWKNRIEAFVNGGDESYQVTQAKIAIANGQVLGVGPGKSTQRNYLPHPYSDFIYVIIIEEYGLIGGTLLLFLYLLFLHRSILVFRRSPGAFGALLAVGLSLSLVMQAMLNMIVNVDLFPVTGIPLPLVSMGGTSTVFSGLAVGIVLSVSRFTEKGRKKRSKRKFALA